MGKKKNDGSNGQAQTVQRELPVQLSEGELLKAGDRMADIELEIDGLKDDRKELNRQIKDREKDRNDLAKKIDLGTEGRLVDCHWLEDLNQNVKTLVRDDTGEVVDTVAMTAADRQEGMSFAMGDQPMVDEDGAEDGADAPVQH